MAPKEKKSKREQLTELVLEFLEATVHQFLFVWKVYPDESFATRVIYDVPVHMSRHPQLCEYVHSMLKGCRQWIREGELEKLQVVLLSRNGSILRRMCIETGWSAVLVRASAAPSTLLSSSWDENDEPLPLVTIAEEFRTAMVALTATPVVYGYRAHGKDDAAASFRLLAHTVEDASRAMTSLDEKAPANSWVYADRHWHDGENDEEQKSTERGDEILPIKSIRSDSFPLRMQLYIENR